MRAQQNLELFCCNYLIILVITLLGKQLKKKQTFFSSCFTALLFFGGAPGFDGSKVVKICSPLAPFRSCGSLFAQRLVF